jgi:tetratricopeptide (TPR) repeat protein
LDLKTVEDEAQKKLNRRLTSMTVFLGILLVPISLGLYQVWSYFHQISLNRSWAEAELAKPDPAPQAYSVMGSVLLGQDRIHEALPLLLKAAELESKARSSAADHINLANAYYLALKKGLPSGSEEKSLAALDQALELATVLPAGPAAAAYYQAGKLYRQWGLKPQALASLKKACDLQKTDWVDLGQGRGAKFEGLANTYAKEWMLASEGR